VPTRLGSLLQVSPTSALQHGIFSLLGVFGGMSLYIIPPDEAKIGFTYDPLPEEQPSIRLLTLAPGHDENPIYCSLTVHIWDPETGFVHPARDIGTEEGLASLM
jgi:hypothetical protein